MLIIKFVASKHVFDYYSLNWKSIESLFVTTEMEVFNCLSFRHPMPQIFANICPVSVKNDNALPLRKDRLFGSGFLNCVLQVIKNAL